MNHFTLYTSMRQKITLLLLAGAAATFTATAQEVPRMVFLGDSLTSGYTLGDNLAYPALIQKKLTEAGYMYRVVNSGVSGDTTAGGYRRLDWLLRQRIDILVIALGANDGLRGLSVDEAMRNIGAMIEKVQAKYPDAQVLLAGMRLPENMGPVYRADFENLFDRVARQHNVPLLPFLRIFFCLFDASCLFAMDSAVFAFQM